MGRLSVFAAMWAIAALFHYWNQSILWGSPQDGIMSLALSVTAVMVLLFPGSLRLFLTFIVFEIIEAAWMMPRIADHWILVLFVNLAIACSSLRLIVSPAQSLNARTLLAEFAPTARLILVVCYAFAALSKVNYDFFNYEVSAAATRYVMIAQSFAWLHLPTDRWAQTVALYGTLIMELSVPVLLLVPRTRFIGFVLGIVFHLLIAMTPVLWISDFSSILFALFVLFTPVPFTDEMLSNVRRVGHVLGPWGRKLLRIATGIIGVLIMLSLAARMFSFKTVLHAVHRQMLFAMFGIYGWTFFCLVLVSLRRKWFGGHIRPITLAIRRPTAIVLVAIAFLNGMCPYLGFKTVGCFAMFSNLRTEMRRSNHVFMPQLYLCDLQNDYVQIIGSSNPWLQNCAERRWLVSRFELTNIASRNPEISLRYIGREGEICVPRVGDDRALSTPHPFLLRKVFRFRPIPESGPSPAVGR